MPGVVPANPDIFHITHVGNLAGIVREGGLWSDSERIARSLNTTNIGYSHIKERRLKRDVPVAVKGKLGDYVPFYFCNRSVMLYVVHQGHENYSGGQDSVIHLVSSVRHVIDLGLSWAFTDRHAELGYAEYFDDLSELEQLDWNAMPLQYWGGNDGTKELRQAEFLVHRLFPWAGIERIGVQNATIAARFKRCSEQAGRPWRFNAGGITRKEAMVSFVTGNLFDARVEALVNTVNTAGAMGKGLALQFKKAFPENWKAYEGACKHGEVQIGRMFVFDAGGIVLPRYIINFPTKKHWRGASKLEYIELGLKDLVRVVRDRKIRSLAIPPLGAGLGGLDWGSVRSLIEAGLQELSDVEVLVFEPKGAPPPEKMRNKTERPRMSAGRAAVLALMSRYLVPGYGYLLSLLEVQKLAYFLQEAGEPLKLDYQKHFYGPYADNLRHVLNRLEGHFIEGFGDGENKPMTPLKVLPGAADEAEAFLASNRATQERLSRVAELIEGFETPFGMELLSTVHWSAVHDAEARTSYGAAVQAVQAWNERKATTMRPEQIRAAWSHLKSQGWLDEPASTHSNS